MNDNTLNAQPRPRRDIIVIGGSAGAIEPLKQILGALPADLEAALFVVVHLGAVSELPAILERAGPLRVRAAQSGLAITHGTVYVATPDKHLLLHDGHLLLRRGPRENLSRPAIDPLFRTAAASYGPRVIGVLLSGSLNDGSAGLRAIKRCGGLAIVQHPHDAVVAGMPQSALRYVDVEHVVPAAAIGPLLVSLVGSLAGEGPAQTPLDIRLEAAIAAQELADMAVEDQLGRPSRYTCPECHGTLWEMDDGNLVRYRCHTGHAFTGESMLAAETQQIEGILYGLLRAHHERADMAWRMAERAAGTAEGERLLRRAREYEEDAELVRKLLVAQSNSDIPEGEVI